MLLSYHYQIANVYLSSLFNKIITIVKKYYQTCDYNLNKVTCITKYSMSNGGID